MRRIGDEDYVFRFTWKNAPALGQVYENPLVELVRVQLESILGVARLTMRGEPVKVDGFSFLCQPEVIYDIWREGGDDGTDGKG